MKQVAISKRGPMNSAICKDEKTSKLNRVYIAEKPYIVSSHHILSCSLLSLSHNRKRVAWLLALVLQAVLPSHSGNGELCNVVEQLVRRL
jgi:hypothetical protein